MLIIHIILALSSLPLMLLAGINEVVSLTKHRKLLPVASLISTLGMLVSGTYLVVTMHQPLVGACLEGLAYLSALAAVYMFARYFTRKLVKA